MLNNPAEIVSRKNSQRKQISIFNVILLLFIIATGTVIYIGNVIAIDTLAVEINALKNEYEKIFNSNAVLKATADRLSSSDRIGQIASQKLQMTYLKQQPIALEIDKVTVQPH